MLEINAGTDVANAVVAVEWLITATLAFFFYMRLRKEQRRIDEKHRRNAEIRARKAIRAWFSGVGA